MGAQLICGGGAYPAPYCQLRACLVGSLFAGVKMGRIPKVEKERALQFQNATTSSWSSATTQPDDQSSFSASCGHVTDGTPQTDISVNGAFNRLLQRGGEPAMNGSTSGVQSASLSTACLQDRDDYVQHAHCSNWVSSQQ